MNRAGAFCATLLALGGACVAAGVLMGAGVLPDPSGGALSEPFWGFLAVVGLLYVVVGAWLLVVLPRRADQPEVLVGYVLFHTARPALLLAGAEALLFAGGWVALALDVRPLSPQDWTLLLGFTVASLFVALLGVLALAWSRGRGTATRKAAAARGLAFASVLAVAPWLLRAAFLA